MASKSLSRYAVCPKCRETIEALPGGHSCGFGGDILSMALEIHMYTTGAGPDLSYDEQHMVAYLRARLANWRVSPPFTVLFDQNVKALVQCALGEFDEHE